MRSDAIFANGHYYHIFNRGVARMPTFSQHRDYEHLLLNTQYYRFLNPPFKFSTFRKQSIKHRIEILQNLEIKSPRLVGIQCFVFMPNHFHFLVRQDIDGGISKFVSQITNSYTKYFNTKYNRVGSLFQGPFKAVLIETEQQLVHVSRYIHLNALIGLVVADLGELWRYPWSSLSDYLKGDSKWLDLDPVLSHFKSPREYQTFITDQADFAKELHIVKHLLLE